MEQPLFSIIVPMHNVEKYIDQCIQSILDQTYDGFELILVDDVSTDNTAKIAANYAAQSPNKITFLQHKVNTRQGGARNTGIDASTGRYLMFVDSDDYIKPETLQILAEAMEQEQADIIEFCHDQVDQHGNFLRRDYWPQWLNAPCSYQKPLLVSKMGPCNKVYRRELFQDGNIRFPVGHFFEDYWTVPKLLMRANKIVYLHPPLYCYRQHNASTMHSRNIENVNDILLGTDQLLDYCHQQQLSDEEMLEFEYLAIDILLISATLLINAIDPKSAMQTKPLEYMRKHFPNFESNPYLDLLPRKKQQLLRLIKKEQYGLLYLFWNVRNRITGTIKRVLHKLTGRS